jgi:hypothetical protein
MWNLKLIPHPMLRRGRAKRWIRLIELQAPEAFADTRDTCFFCFWIITVAQQVGGWPATGKHIKWYVYAVRGAVETYPCSEGTGPPNTTTARPISPSRKKSAL